MSVNNDDWYYLEERVAAGPGDICGYWVSVEAGCLLIQIRIGTGAIVRHLFPRGSIETLTTITMPDGTGHQVCLNPTFLVDSVIFQFGSALEALRFHWAVATKIDGARGQEKVL